MVAIKLVNIIEAQKAHESNFNLREIPKTLIPISQNTKMWLENTNKAEISPNKTYFTLYNSIDIIVHLAPKSMFTLNILL